MSENQSRLERGLYDYEHDEPRTSGGRRRRPVADWGVGDDVFDHMPRNRFSRVADTPRERRSSSHPEAGERRASADERDAVADREDAATARGGEHSREATAAAAEDGEAGTGREAATGREAVSGRAGRARRTVTADWLTDTDERAIAGTDERGVGVGGAAQDDEDPIDADEAPPRRRTAPRRDGQVPRGRVDDGRRTIVIGRPEDVPSEIAAITADRDIDDEPPPEPAHASAPGERRTIRIGGRPEGSLEATRAQRRRPPRTAHERVGARPDRVAAYAVALGVLLILIAVLSAL